MGSATALLLLAATWTITAAETPPLGEARFLSRVRQLTFEGRRSGEGYFSSDGQALIFQSEREPNNPFYQIYFLDLVEGIVWLSFALKDQGLSVAREVTFPAAAALEGELSPAGEEACFTGGWGFRSRDGPGCGQEQ